MSVKAVANKAKKRKRKAGHVAGAQARRPADRVNADGTVIGPAI